MQIADCGMKAGRKYDFVHILVHVHVLNRITARCGQVRQSNFQILY
jgi:hypothetical protein